MKKKKKGKVRWLSLLLTGCLLLSVIPATAFAAEDTVAAESKDTTAEETQLSGQKNETEKSTTEDVTPAPEQETNDENSKISNTSETDKNVTEEKTSENVTEKVSENDNKDEKSDTANENSSEQVSTYADKPDFLPEGVTDVSGSQGVEVKTIVRNNYTDIRTDETVTYANGIALVDGDESALNGRTLTFKGLGNLTIQAAYDSANNKTTLTLDISNIQRQTEEQKYLYTEYKENKSKMTTTYDGSKLSYTGTTKDPETGKIIINEIRDDYYIRTHVYERACLIIPAAESITSAAVQNVNFNYQPGDAPRATAEVYNADADKYEIAYECWQEFENNEPVAAWYSDNGSHGSLPTFTAFESGKKYVYSLMLKPKDGYSFSNETAVTVNGENVTSSLSGNYLYVSAVKTITMPTIKVIDVVEVNGVTVSFKDGDKPVFTGNTPDGAHYMFRCEWWEYDSNTGLLSTEPEWGSDIYKNKITAFEAEKTYHYGVFVSADGDIGNVRYVFGPDTKLKINGKFVNYKQYEGYKPDFSDGTTMSMWVLTDLTMTPETGGTIPVEKYTVTYTDGVDGEEVFKDQTYTVESGKTTPAFNGTPTRKGYTFAGWKPAVAATVTGNAIYEATWKSNAETITTPSENKINTNKTTSPKTGDTSNILQWIALLFVSGGALTGAVVIGKKKKKMKWLRTDGNW